jgi:hypothetical protein
MPNVDNPHGLRPLMRTLSGGVPFVQEMTKDASEAAAIFQWDAVNREADGNIEANSATPGSTLFSGVALNHGAAATLTTHLVVVSPNALFEAQDNNDTDGIAEADLGLNANIELNAGNALTKISKHEIDESTAAVTATLDLHLLQKLNVPDNAFGSFCRVEVMFANHRMASAAVGV